MGLDIYLYEKTAREQNARHDAEWEALWERRDKGEITETEYDDLRKTITQCASHEDVQSETEPGHLFNRRYLRSSYNGGGFNRAVPALVGADHGLYWIFEPMGREWDGDEGVLTEDDIPRLAESKARAQQVADEIQKSDGLRVLSLSPNPFAGTDFLETSDDDALAQVRAKVAEGHGAVDDGEWWGSLNFDWFGGSLEVVATVWGGATFGGGPALHVVYKGSDEGRQSYVNSALITAEFCDEAVTLIRRDGSAYMSWSG